MRWLAHPDIYDDPSEDVLEWLRLSRVARFYKKGPWEIVDLPAFWLDLGELDMDFQQALNQKAQKKG
jgi:hypothetical protein